MEAARVPEQTIASNVMYSTAELRNIGRILPIPSSRWSLGLNITRSETVASSCKLVIVVTNFSLRLRLAEVIRDRKQYAITPNLHLNNRISSYPSKGGRIRLTKEIYMIIDMITQLWVFVVQSRNW